MGSGSSARPKTAPAPSDSNKSQSQNLPGNANPPKRPPIQRQAESAGVRGNNQNTNKPQTNSTVALNRTNGSESRQSTNKRQDSKRKSEYVSRHDTKTIVRQMEMGMENDEDVENILGIDRLKTKMYLKREKTKNRRDDNKNKPIRKFQAVASKLYTTAKKREGPMTEEDKIYMGDVTLDCPLPVKIVRIFTSSTFTDTKNERNSLMEVSYPKIKSFCQQLGYDFQVVDMRWGIRDEASDDLMGTEICLRELEMCKKLSTGPYFVSLMSHKYGYTDFPRCINANEYESIFKKIESQEIVDLFNKWYNKDNNAIPAEYVSYPVSYNIPDFISKDKDKRMDAKKQWWKESEVIQSTLEDIAQQVFDVHTARKYIRSVTETEVYNGLLNSKDPIKQCLWLKRTIEDIEDQECSFLVSRYMECTFNNPESKIEKVRGMMDQIKSEMSKKLGNNICEYKIKWDPVKGLDPDDKQHKAYLERLNTDFVSKMCTMIQDAVNEKSSKEDPVLEEIIQHIGFCQDKCRGFHGRDDIMKQVITYINGMSDEPLVLYGASGCGKTSVMAKAAWNSCKFSKKNATVVLRFIGTSPNSSNVIGLLTSITTQIRKAYGMNIPVSKDFQALTNEFNLCMFMASSEQPLIIILDSLDMLDPSHNARQLNWLPTRLRTYVKIIVSTLPESQFEAFPSLQAKMKTPDNFIKVPSLTNTDLDSIIDRWLELKDRRLTEDQKKILLHACNKCPLPLFVKLSFDKAVMWTSFVPANSTVLEPSIRKCIDCLFERLEVMHGKIFVSRALGYLTLAKSGLTETELEDILSCDDDVLNDVYMYWTPPSRRLPPLLLVRLRADLDQYLADRGADGARVMYWYHRQFIESAQVRYCSNEDLNKKLHAAIADFFSGRWANGKKKPYTTPSGQNESADRRVADQLNKFGESYNLRKLNNLPYHRCLAYQCEALKEECLCNFQFLLDKLNATSLWQIMDDFTMAKEHFPNDDLLCSINDTLHLAQEGLLYDPNQLIPQMLGRLPRNKNTQQFLDKCKSVAVPSLLPDKHILVQPGGQLIHCMAGHTGDVLSLDITSESKTALTSSTDGSIRLWNIETGQQIQCYDGFGKISRARFCYNDEYIIIDINNKLAIRATRTGEKIHDIISVTDDFPSCLCGNNKSTLVVFKQHSALIYQLEDASLQYTLECSDSVEFMFPGFAVGSKNYAAVTTSDQIYLTILDLKKRQFSPLFRGFEPFNDEELGEEVQYEIDELVITRDEKFVVYSNIYTNDIVFMDFHSKKKTNIIRGNPNEYMRSLKQSNDGKSLYFVKGSNVHFLDIKTSKASAELKHSVDVTDACTVDMKTVVTTSEDSNVRVWDRTKAIQNIGQSSTFCAHKIRMMESLPNSRYVVAFGFKTSEPTSQILFVYDVFKHITVRERSLDCSILHMEVLSDKELLVVHDVIQKIKIINLDTLTVTKEFQGYLSSRKMTFAVIKSRNEVACLSFGRHNLKVYNIQTGKVSAILETRQKAALDGFSVSENGQTMAAWRDDTSEIFIFDVVHKKLLHKVESDFTAILDENQLLLTLDGKYLLFKVEGVPTFSRKEKETMFLEVWDVQKGKKMVNILDMEYYNKYSSEKDKSELSASIDTFVMLNNTQILAAHDDFIVRVYDIKSGKILHRLFGHTTCVEIIYSPDNPYILTFGSWTEEMTLRVWDKNDFSTIASFTLDESVTNLQFSKDDKFILATVGKPVNIVTWKLHNFKQVVHVNESQYPELLKGSDTKGDLDLVPEEEELILDPMDPDKDMIAEDSDDDDDDFV
ncbi:hypothetical protein ACF0H5_005044 [Mactra antiquata]